MPRDNRKEEPKEEEEEMDEIQFWNEMIRVIKDLKVEKENVKSLKSELKIVK